jgi:glucokinase-like ROK family protein
VQKDFRLTLAIDCLPRNAVKLSNKHSALNLIRYTPGGISRAELARCLGLSRAAISSIAKDLLQIQLIREAKQGAATGGRSPILLEINPDFGYVAGVDIGATHIGLILTDFAAQILNISEMPFDVSQGPEPCLAEIDSCLRDFLAQSVLTLADLKAVGVGVPGPVVVEKGSVIAPPIMPGWDRFPIQQHLEKQWKCPITLNNDAELGALGEWAYGAGRAECYLLFVKVGYGIGAGLLINGQIYRGATGCAGEIGHTTINENGPLCTCGNRGCLEAMAGGRSIVNQAHQAIESGRRTQLAAIPPEKLTAADLAVAARQGDLLAQEIVAQVGKYIGIALASVINIVNPGMIIVGGSISLMGDLILEPIRQIATKRSLPAAAQDVRITAAFLGQRSSSLGAIAQALSISTLQRLQS